MVDPSIRLKRVRHPWKVILLAGFLVLCVAASFLAGLFIAKPERDNLAAAQQEIPVFIGVQQTTVAPSQSFTGQVRAGTSEKIVPTSPAGVAVVTRQALSAGDTTAPGKLLGVISGQPFYALPAPLSLYRNLATGDEGDDVRLLQRSLAAAGYEVRETGEVDWATWNAYRLMLKQDGFEAAPNSIDVAALLPTAGGVVSKAAAVGDEVSDERPLLELRTSSNSVVFRADASASATLVVGQALKVTVNGETFDAQVAAIGDFVDGGDGKLPGRDVHVTSGASFDPFVEGASATVSTIAEPIQGLGVPLIGVRTDSGGDYVLVKDETLDASSAADKTRRVSVAVVGSADGWAVVDSPELVLDDQVLVS